jgi:hypothetical protein
MLKYEALLARKRLQARLEISKGAPGAPRDFEARLEISKYEAL